MVSRAEDRGNAWLVRALTRRGYRPRVVPYPSYGTVDRVRVRARVLLTRPDAPAPGAVARRGWRNLLSAEVPGAAVRVRTAPDGGGEDLGRLRTDRGGYLDAVLPLAGDPGWRHLYLSVEDGDQDVPAPVQVVHPDARRAVVSDIDDTVLVTMVPRLHVAAWNFLVRTEQRRKQVPGMPELYRALVDSEPPTPVFYLSNGAWNTAGLLGRFLDRVGLPRGALLLTDFGPTGTALMRSGRVHKAQTLSRLAAELPDLTWVLVGDDGQHDPQIYREFAERHPDRVQAIAIRRLSAAEQVVASGVPAPAQAARRAMGDLGRRGGPVLAHAQDGWGLADQLRDAGVL